MLLLPVMVPVTGIEVGADPSMREPADALAWAWVIAPAKAEVELGSGLPSRSNLSPARTTPSATNATQVSAWAMHDPSASLAPTTSESAVPTRSEVPSQTTAPALRFAPWIEDASDVPESVSGPAPAWPPNLVNQRERP